MLSEFAVRRWQFTLVACFALAALGLYALATIPKAEDPTFPIPTFSVVTVMAGSSPKDIERSVVDPLEARLKALGDVKSIQTEINDGLAATFVEFRADADANRKYEEVMRETNAVRSSLSANLVQIEVRRFNPANTNIFEVALVSDSTSYYELARHVRALRRRFDSVPGVDKVEISGLPAQHVWLTLDLPRMVTLGITADELYRAVSAEAVAIPAGSIEAGTRRFNVKTGGEYASLEEIADTMVRAQGGRVVRVRDLADVQLKDEEPIQLARFNGQRAVLVAVAQKEGQDIFAVRQALDTELSTFESTLPASIRLARGFDQSHNVSHRLNGLARDFVIAILLVLLTLLPLGLRASAVVMVSIPLSLAMGMLAMSLLGYTLNQLSVVGFVIALGLLVDDSVVVVENITRHIRSGLTPRDAAIRATKEITPSVIGCTATLVLAFLPLLALPGTAGQFIRSMPVAVVATVLASLAISLTIVPFLASIMLRNQGPHGNLFFRTTTRFVEYGYRPVLRWALRHPIYSLVLSGCTLAGALALVPHIGFSLFPKAGTPQFMVDVETAEGASLPETDRATRYVEGILSQHPEVQWFATSVGKGHPRIYYNSPLLDQQSNIAQVAVEAHPGSNQARATLYAELRDAFSDYPGARIELREFENGPPLDAPIAIRVLSNDEIALSLAARQVQTLMEGTAGTRDVRNPELERRTDLRVTVDREKAAALGVAPSSVDQTVRLALEGITLGAYHESDADVAYTIRATLPRAPRSTVGESRAGVDVFEQLYVPGIAGAVPLTQLATVELEPSASKVRHYNQERSVTLTASVDEGYNTNRVTAQVLSALSTLTLPAATRVVPAGEFENRQESFSGLGIAVLVAAFGLLSVLVLEFGTFKSSLIVASVIPLGAIGGLAALWLTQNTLSFTASVGFVALMGIEVKNSILLVDFTNQLRRQGISLEPAILAAGETRFVPILLTTLTAVGGLLPLVFEKSALYSPLALVILGGLISSTFLTRIVTSVLYKLLPPDVSDPLSVEPGDPPIAINLAQNPVP